MLLALLLTAVPIQDLQVRAVDELLPIFPDRMPLEEVAVSRLDAARGTIAAVHILIRGHGEDVALSVTPTVEGGLVARTYRLLAVPVEENTGLESRTLQWDGRANPHVIREAPFEVFDPIQPFEGSFVPDPDHVEAVRVEVEVPVTATPGPRTLEIALDQGGHQALVSLPLVVHGATVPEIGRDTMRFTNWFGPAGIGTRFDAEPWSEEHWRLLERYAELMARTRQNVFEVPLGSFLTPDEDGAYSLVRERFERYVETFSSRGIYWMEGRHIASRPGGDWGATELELRIGTRPWPRVGTPEAEARVAAWFAPIREVLEAHGWQERWLQHLADEPTDTNSGSYRELADSLRRQLPGVRILEATMSTKLVGAVDVWCPQTRAFQESIAFFRERREAGDEVWVYSCLAPGGPWLNRLLDQERLRAVYMGWGASRDGVTGYLHWGYNRWKADPYAQSVVDHPQVPGTKNKLPAGDTHVTYPPPDGSPGILSSLRLEAHRLGLEDHELLQALRERDPENADDLIAQVFLGWDAYEVDPAAYRVARVALLQAVGNSAGSSSDRDDILVADFEDGYGDWSTTGEALGPGPAKGTLPNQMQVTGYRGEALVNSFFEGDGTTGTLTSPPFTVERRHLVFLIGGGGYEGTTCMNLLLDGEVVRTATGPNTAPGGSEELTPWAWDLADLAGRTVTIQIVDERTGSWGHVNVDHIVLSDRKPEIPVRPGPQTSELRLAKRFLLLPIRTGAKKTRVDLRIDGRDVRQFDAELAGTREEASFWSFLDVSSFRGQSATLHLDTATEEGLALIVQSNELPVAADLYDEPMRPQLRFSQRLGWNNDPNGMVYYDGEWHLYFQHNPYGWRWGNMHWGHAVSRDLVHWEQLPIAIYNKRHGDWAFSGGAVVDERNTAGWQAGDEKVIVASWTSTGRGECIAYSNDRGRTFTEFEGNPVVEHNGRDPKIIWYTPGEHWVMAVYSHLEDTPTIAFHSSKDLKEWKLESHLEGYYECPEFFELPLDGNTADTRWVVFAADGQYAIGAFDGKTFTPSHGGKHRVHHGRYYASQTFSNAPNGRRIQIGWAQIEMPDMPFNQTFSFPHELTLRSTNEGVRMFAEPVREIEELYGGMHTLENEQLIAGQPVALPVSGELFDVRASFELGRATTVGLDVGGNRIVYDVMTAMLEGATLAPVDGRIEIRVLVDRPMLEIIANRGRVFITRSRESRGDVISINAFAEGGAATLLRLEVHELESIWSDQ